MKPDMTQAEAIAALDKFRNEEAFQQWVINAAVQLGWNRELIYHTRDSRKSTKGFPDLCMVQATLGKKSRLLFAELKMPEGKMTHAQSNWQMVLRSLELPEVEVYVWRPADMDTILEVLS